MIEKRFKLAYCDYDWWAICDNENNNELGISGQEVVDLMNELNDENEAFKNSDNITELETEIMKLKEENKELKEQLKDCTKKAKEEIRKEAENDAIRWINIGR